MRLEARLSEPPEIRARVAAEARQRLVDAGADADATTVQVLSAFKQGFSWLRGGRSRRGWSAARSARS